MIAMDVPAKEDVKPEAVESCEAPSTEGGSSCSGSSVDQNMKTTQTGGWWNWSGTMAAKRKYLSELMAAKQPTWVPPAQWRIVKFNFNEWQLIWIMLITLFTIVCSVWAMWMPNWVTDNERNFGLWNVCWHGPKNNMTTWEGTWDNGKWEKGNWMNDTDAKVIGWWCWQQELGFIADTFAKESRITAVHLAQGFIVCGTFFYFMSMITMWFAYCYSKKHLDTSRNFYAATTIIQMIAFWMHLIGFCFFIYTERHSFSMIAMFCYFFFVVFFSRVIDFISIDFKVIKLRQTTMA